MTVPLKKRQNRRDITPRFKHIEHSDAIASSVGPYTVASQRGLEEHLRKENIRNKASKNRALYPELRRITDYAAANYIPGVTRFKPSDYVIKDTYISEYDPVGKVSQKEIEKKVDQANYLNTFYTNLGQPLPTINKNRVIENPELLDKVDAAINYGINSPAMSMIQTAATLGRSGIGSAARSAWKAGSNLFTKTAGVAGRLAVRNPGAAATVALTTLPSARIFGREYNSNDLKNLGIAGSIAFSPEIISGIRLIPGLGKFIPKFNGLGGLWSGTKNLMLKNKGIVPRGIAFTGYNFLTMGTPIPEKKEMSSERMGEVVEPTSTSAPAETNQTAPQDSVLLPDGTYSKVIRTLPDY